MKKGISPIVAVVLLIAIAVIAAVGLYFWVGGLATKQPTPGTPKTISAYAVNCGDPTVADNATIMIANTSPPGNTIDLSTLQNSAGLTMYCSGTLDSGQQAACKIADFDAGYGTIAIYGSDVASATVTC